MLNITSARENTGKAGRSRGTVILSAHACVSVRRVYPISVDSRSLKNIETYGLARAQQRERERERESSFLTCRRTNWIYK